MKKTFWYWITASCCMMNISCSPYTLDDENDSDNQPEITVVTRTNEDVTMEYPLQVFAFNEEGTCVQAQEISSDNEAMHLQLPQGNYRIVAVAGNSKEEYSLENVSSWEKEIEFKNKQFAHHALIMGSSNVELNDKDKQVSIAMSYVVAALQFNLSEIPDSATAIKVHISPVNSAINFKMEYKNDEVTASVKGEKNGDFWSTGTFFVLPDESRQSIFSIELTFPHSSLCYGYTFNEKLKANQPYIFNGNFKNGASLGGDFTIEGWQPSKEVDFIFGTNTEDQPADPDNPAPEIPEDGTIIINEIPSIKSIWNGCFLWQIKNETDDEADLILFAPEHFLIQVSETASTLAGYHFNGWKGWRTFTEEEAKQLREEYEISNIDDINDILESNGLDFFRYGDDDRYLCENGNKSFNFQTGGNISSTGLKKEYYLCPVKTVHVKLKR